jgi:uncharacterized sulfatase
MKKSRREFLKNSATAAVGAFGACGPRSGEKGRPNILFAFADDQSFPRAALLDDAVLRTPAYDRVAREGVEFEHSYAACPSCTPSRSAVLTGRHIWQVGEGGVLYGTLPKEYPVFPLLLQDAGYHVGYTGKGWGPGDWTAGGLERYPIGNEYNSQLVREETVEGLDRRDYAANFEAFLDDRPTNAPFFFWFGCTEPHRIYKPGIGLTTGIQLEQVRVPDYWPDTEVIRSDILDYYFEVQWFDSHLERMLNLLEQRGELDDTIIVATSDNGMPFPRAKVNLYDPGVRMPLAIRWGERVSGERTVSDFVSHTDFAPTFLEAAGIRPPLAMTGRSLLGILTSNDSGAIEAGRDFAVTAVERHTWCRPDGATFPIRAIRTRDFLYLRNFEPERWPTGGAEFVSSNKTFHGDVDGCPTKDFMVAPENREQYPIEYDLCFGKRPAEELYDVRSDPDQVKNLADQPPYQEVKEALRNRLESYLTETGDPRLKDLDPWQAYVYRQTIGFGATFNRSLPEEERRRASERGAHKPE